MASLFNQHHSTTANVPEDMTGRPRRVATGGLSFRKTFSAFKHRNFRLYFFGQLVSFTGSWMTTTAQGWLVYQLTGSKALLGLVAAAASAPMLFFATWGGWVADRYKKRSVIVVTIGHPPAPGRKEKHRRVGGRSIQEALRHRRDSDLFDDPVAHHGRARLDANRAAVAHHCAGHPGWNQHGVRHAGAAIVRDRDDQPRRFDERDLAQ